MKSSTDNLTPNKGVTCGICKRSPISGGSANLTYTPGFGDHDRAAAESKDADISIVFVGTLSHEGGDRRSLSLDDGGPEADQNALIEAVAAANPNTVVVMAVPGAPMFTLKISVRRCAVRWKHRQRKSMERFLTLAPIARITGFASWRRS